MQKLWNIFLDITYRPSNFGCIAALLIFIKREAVVEDLWCNLVMTNLNSHSYFLCPFINCLIKSFQYVSFDHKFSWKAKCKRFQFFTFKMFRIWNTRRSATETMSFPVELCHIWSCYSPNFFTCYLNSISFTLYFIGNCLLAPAMNFDADAIFFAIQQVLLQSLISNEVIILN